jgi:hypothetical protein
MNEELIPNKVAKSGLITISLQDYYPEGERCHLDISEWLYEGLILREKEFRQHVKDHDWTQYEGCFVWVNCTADAIIPQWAYMLISAALSDHARAYAYGNREQLESILFEASLDKVDFSDFKDQRVILKGCGDIAVPPNAFSSLTRRLKPYVKSLMYGEACSTVPVYKKRN